MSKTSDPRLSPRYRRLDAYDQGLEAWAKGKEDRHCPYPIGSGDNRVAWFAGYYDAKFAPLVDDREDSDE